MSTAQETITDAEDEQEWELPDTYFDRIDGHWYVIRYGARPQIHARDCETCEREDSQSVCPNCQLSPAYRRLLADPWDRHEVCIDCGYDYTHAR